MNNYFRIIGCAMILGGSMSVNTYAGVTALNTTLASRTVDAAVIKKSHEALCEQMGGIDITNKSQLTVSSGVSDAVVCFSAKPNKPLNDLMKRGALPIKPEAILGPLSLEDIAYLNSLPPANEKKTLENPVDLNKVTLTAYVTTGETFRVGTQFNFFGWADYANMPMPSLFNLGGEIPENNCGFSLSNQPLGAPSGQISSFVVCTASAVGSIDTYSTVRIGIYFTHATGIINQYR